VLNFKAFPLGVASTTLLTLSFGSVAQSLTLESAALGTTNNLGGYGVATSQYLGWRFDLTEALQVTAIGGHLGQLFPEKLFGAIVQLDNSTALPSDSPADLPTSQKLKAYTTFGALLSSADLTTPLSVLLNPGSYALIFGSGQFGATGRGYMPFNNRDRPNASYFFSIDDQYVNGGIRNTRFVVQGNPVTAAVPTPALLPGLIGLGVAALRRRKAEKVVVPRK
jgi:hypothetical protein